MYHCVFYGKQQKESGGWKGQGAESKWQRAESIGKGEHRMNNNDNQGVYDDNEERMEDD